MSQQPVIPTVYSRGSDTLACEKTCLVIVDVQEKLAAVMHNPEELKRNLVILTQAAKLLGLPIIYCEQYPKALGPTIPELRDHLQPVKAIDKMSFSCLGSSDFKDALKRTKCTKILLAGIEAHICVCQTAIDLLDGDYDVHLIANAISSRRINDKELAIRRLEQEGARLSSTEMALFELLRTAEHPKFKQIAKLIK